jgi:hypothetical protein
MDHAAERPSSIIAVLASAYFERFSNIKIDIGITLWNLPFINIG